MYSGWGFSSFFLHWNLTINSTRSQNKMPARYDLQQCNSIQCCSRHISLMSIKMLLVLRMAWSSKSPNIVLKRSLYLGDFGIGYWLYLAYKTRVPEPLGSSFFIGQEAKAKPAWLLAVSLETLDIYLYIAFLLPRAKRRAKSHFKYSDVIDVKVSLSLRQSPVLLERFGDRLQVKSSA